MQAEETPGLSEARQVLETALRLHAANEEDVAIGLEWLDTYADEARRPLLDALGKVERDLKAIVPHSDPLAPWWYKERVEEVVQKLIRLRNLGEAYVEHAPKPPRWAYEEPAERALGGDSGGSGAPEDGNG